MSTKARIIGRVSHQISKDLPDAPSKPCKAKVVGFDIQVARQSVRIARASQKAQKRAMTAAARRDASNLMRLKSLGKGEMLTYKPFSCLIK